MKIDKALPYILPLNEALKQREKFGFEQITRESRRRPKVVEEDY